MQTPRANSDDGTKFLIGWFLVIVGLLFGIAGLFLLYEYGSSQNGVLGLVCFSICGGLFLLGIGLLQGAKLVLKDM